jgi:formylglycine-generating enzyme required for sulfatase activity
MSFSANGTLSGTPPTAGTYTFVIRLESGGYWDEVEVELEVVNTAFSFNPDMVEISSAEPVSLGYPLPEKSVLLPNYLIAKDETTFSQWDYVVKKAKVKLNWTIAAGVAGSGYTDVSVPTPQHPVTHITFVDAALWCNAASIMAGLEPCYSTKDSNSQIIPLTPSSLNQAQANGIVWSKQANGYRFPTGDEWEVAARGGLKSQVYPWGNTSANAQNSNWVIFTGYPNNTTPVGTYTRNGFGLSDCAGNVLEITWDTTLAPADEVPTELKNYVVRGGGWQQGYQPKITFGHAGRPFWDSSDAFGFRLARNVSGNMVTVQGGTLPTGSGLAGQTVSTFQIGKYEVTWGEWKAVRAWAAANGYSDLATVGEGSADNHPVRNVSWFDVVKWCNAKSEKEGLTPVYNAYGAAYRTGTIPWYSSSVVAMNSVANGYRLPEEKEWEWAARGGVSSQGYTHSGSNDVNAVAWYWDNSGSQIGTSSYGTNPVGTKAANELGIFDMTGNVWEWCWDLNGYDRRSRGGGWTMFAAECAISSRKGFDPAYRYYYGGGGLRVARSSRN